MRINKINSSKADVSLDPSELVLLSNVLYFYEQHWQDRPNWSKPGDTFHGLAKQIAIARDLCQYGHIDGHTLGVIVGHDLALHPDGQLRQKLDKLDEARPAAGGGADAE